MGKHRRFNVVGLAALDMVQPWAELDVAGVGLSFANWMAVVIAPYIVFVLMLDLLHFVFRSRVACLWIGPRLALAARCGQIYSLSQELEPPPTPNCHGCVCRQSVMKCMTSRCAAWFIKDDMV